MMEMENFLKLLPKHRAIKAAENNLMSGKAIKVKS